MAKLFITGAGGFIGSHLTEACVEAGYDVKAFIRYNGKNHWGWLEESPVKKEIEVYLGDVRDYDSVHHGMQGCDQVLHLAALIGIPYSYVSPLAYVRTNVEGTYNVLEAARQQDIRNLVVTSTSETYGTAQSVPIREDHPLVGQSPYSATKIGADQLAISYFRSFGLPVKIARPFNTYGPRQSARAFIVNVLSQMLAGRREIRVGTLTPTRDLTFVKDTARGLLAILGAAGLQGEVTNIGMNEEVAMGDVAKMAADILQLRDLEFVSEPERVRPAQSEVERLRADSAKIQSATGWRPQYDLRRGLTETIAWMRDHAAMYKHDRYAL
jgi:NAD dependent epimerase/dehydratase